MMKSEQMKPSPLWGTSDLPGPEPVLFDFGPLLLWCKKESEIFRLTHERVPSETKEKTPRHPREDAEWTRFIICEQHEMLQIQPAFPDRAVVVKPETPFILAPKAQTTIFVRCPIWARIRLEGKSPLTLVEIPIVELSSTWFGEMTEGELCYWISTTARHEPLVDSTRPYLAICPMKIVNQSPDELPVEKICLRVGGLTLFDHDGCLWSDQINVTYKGKNSVSQVTATGKPAKEIQGKSTKMTDPRQVAKKQFSIRTFGTIKALPGLGFLVP